MRLLVLCLACAGTSNGAPAPCASLVAGLAERSQDSRDRAALAAWRECDRRELSAIPGAGRLLASAAKADHGGAAAVVLLGYFPGETTRSALASLEPEARVKLLPWDPLVPQRVARDVALVLLNEAEARARLKAALSDPAAAVFLLRVSRDIHDKDLLATLARLLDDERPAGVGAEGEPQMRVCDVALESLVQRFGLQPPFRLQTRRYDASERRTVAAMLPH